VSVLDPQTIGRASFDKIEFPVLRRSAKLSTRYHLHEFPRQAGAALEKLGRKAWEFTLEVPFHATFPAFPGLYPGRLDALQTLALKMDTAPLFLPEIGTIRAVLVEMERKRDGKSASGEDVSLHFVEDDLEPFQHTTVPSTAQGLNDAAKAYAQKRGELEAANPTLFAFDTAKRKPKGSIFGALDDALNSVAAIGDQAALFGNLFAAKLGKVMSLCQDIHKTVAFMKAPTFHPLAQAIRSVWDAANALRLDLQKKGPKQIPYVVPATMSVGSIALGLYGDTSRGGEILSLNAIRDPFAVRANTTLLVYQPGA
jgi:prophage DNA circulation protein